jgi:hypothetical protein
VFSALSISPANADSITVNDVVWEIYAGYMSRMDDTFYDAYGLDSSEFLIAPHGVDSFNNFSCDGTETVTTESDSDVIVECDDFEASGVTGIEWTGHVKVFAGAYDGLVARQVITLKNITAADISVDYEYYLDTEECYPSDGGMVGTPDGDLIVETGETWWAGNNNNDALEGIAFGSDGYARGDGANSAADEGFGIVADDTIIDADGFDEFYSWNDAGVTVPAGDTINFVYFYSSIGASEHGSSATGAVTDNVFNAEMESNFGDPATVLANTRLMEGIVGGAYNWGATLEDDSEELAETGRVDASGIAFGGALALAAGVGVYALRRRGARA